MSGARLYVLGWATPERNHFLDPEPSMIQVANPSPDVDAYVKRADYTTLAAENARLTTCMAEVRKKSSARKLALRDRNAKMQRLSTNLARLQAELKEARALLLRAKPHVANTVAIDGGKFFYEIEAAMSRSEEGR
jgi:hypothetical protein